MASGKPGDSGKTNPDSSFRSGSPSVGGKAAGDTRKPTKTSKRRPIQMGENEPSPEVYHDRGSKQGESGAVFWH